MMGKITGKFSEFDGKNHGFRLRFSLKPIQCFLLAESSQQTAKPTNSVGPALTPCCIRGVSAVSAMQCWLLATAAAVANAGTMGRGQQKG